MGSDEVSGVGEVKEIRQDDSWGPGSPGIGEIRAWVEQAIVALELATSVLESVAVFLENRSRGRTKGK